MTEQDLIAAGYRRWENTTMFRAAGTYFYQRAVMEDDKKAYLINVQIYPPDYSCGCDHVTMSAEVQLYLSDGDPWMTLQLHYVQVWTVALMEAAFFEAYVKLGCIPDVHNN